MKKVLPLLMVVLIGGIVGLFYFFSDNQNNSSQSNNLFTPNEIWENQIKEKRQKGESDKTDKPNEFTKYFKSITTKFGETKSSYQPNYRVNELVKAKQKRKNKKLSLDEITWVQRGPANVGGRTRGIIIDPDDASHKTWFAGAATGGIWKTVDGGQNWVCLTDNLPNLSTNTIVMAESNHNIIYAGTGESFPGGTYLQGSGIFKSVDRGATWTQLANTTTDDFEYINRIVVDPSDANIVIAATESGIMKSVDGGTIWTKVYSSSTGIEDLDADPKNFNKLYAAENRLGIVRSINAGDNWNVSSDGINGGTRFEIAISPVNTNIIYVSQNISSNESYIYRSEDSGLSWKRFQDKNNSNKNFLGGQGDYDNTIVAHPFDQDIAFLGGVNLWKVDFSKPGTSLESDPQVMKVDTTATGSFLDFVSFNGSYFNGAMEIGNKNNATDLVNTDWCSVEIRFGPGIVQKAHRFEVPATSGANGDGGSGVPASAYEYKDYVEVPFQVWDVTNNRQLMVSFRDQERDGKFNLFERDPDDNVSGREYLFVNAVKYSETESPEIAKNTGHSYKQLYFFWPTLTKGGAWDDTKLPTSKISIEYGTFEIQKGTTYNVSDAYGSISGNNTYNQSTGFGTTLIPGVHPDHHNLVIIPINESIDSFLVVNGNDGGLAISYNSGKTFNQLPNNYITTQFYGVAKRSGANEFIGGMQDNGTWISQEGEDASEKSNYLFQIGGDGFECIWNSANPDKIIGSVYNNSFRKTIDGGASWSSATSGIIANDGPFISRISTHVNTPDVLYAVGSKGVYKSTNFGTSWSMKNIGEGWTGNGSVTSQHNVEVSLANENIVWAGAAMAENFNWKIFVSTDQGENYNPVVEFADADLSGYISGIATHPTDENTAYLLFSFSGEPKILRTQDLGQTWEDLSGFAGNTSSSNGFPDVVVNCLLVFPDDPNTIWVGTDIGLFESNDNGLSWHYADNGLPAVSVYDMFFQDDQVVVATHGRGIWTARSKNIPEIECEYKGEKKVSISYKIVNDADSVEVYIDNVLNKSFYSVSGGTGNFEITLDDEAEYLVKIINYIGVNSYESNTCDLEVSFKPIIKSLTKLDNPVNTISINALFKENYDSVQLYVNDNYVSTIGTFKLGENVFQTEITSTRTYLIKLRGYINGIEYISDVERIYVIYTGINSVSKIRSLNIYPNPSQGNIKVDLPENLIGSYNINVYSLTGSKVHSESISNTDNELNLGSLNNGVYIVRIENEGIIYSQKVKIQK